VANPLAGNPVGQIKISSTSPVAAELSYVVAVNNVA
jgi:hypothetical protein